MKRSMRYFFYDVIQSEPWGHVEKKEWNKTSCNQNMPALPLSDDL